MKRQVFKVLGLAVLLAALLVACAAPAAAVTVEGAWGKISPSIPGAGGVYMLIKNSGGAPDRLMSAKSPACGMVEVHEMVKKADGTMGMNLIENPLVIPAGGQVELKVGSFHIMCMMMKGDQFKPGNKIDVTLMFEKSGEKTVSAEIRAE